MDKNSCKKQIRYVIEEAKEMRDRIGSGGDIQHLSDIFLANSLDSTLTGQAYEDLHYAYHALQRFIDGAEDVLAIQES